MRIGLVQSRFPHSLADGLSIVENAIQEASEKQCKLICFPESILPGLRGVGYDVEQYDHGKMESAIKKVSLIAKELDVAVVLPTEWRDEVGYHIVAFVIDNQGQILGYQVKNQIDPSEDSYGFVAGKGRDIFEINGLKFGISICHEGWRYPETVRWAALRDARIVFHPQYTGAVHNPEFFNTAMVCRSLENNIYFGSVNYALEQQGTVTTVISPEGEKLREAGHNREEIVIWDIEIEKAHCLLAKRFQPHLLS